ncbi:MAG: FMN-binding protein [Planctomycetes bacterium]|nr:FMN-binding protein [Planctomycetota bacterium]
MSEQNQDNPGILAKMRTYASGHGNPNMVRLYTIIYVLVITAFFGGAVSLLNSALIKYKLENEKVSQQQVILKLLGLMKEDQDLSAKDTASIFEDKVETYTVEGRRMKGTDGKSAEYTYYGLKGSESGLYVIPIWGDGFWGLIVGRLAIDTSKEEITGIDFVRHEETPGLGGRISDEEVRQRFVGKSYATKDAEGLRIDLVAEGTAGDSKTKVDAITGATGTSSGVEKLLNAGIDLFIEIRKGGEK